MSSSQHRRFRKLARAGGSKELTTALASGNFRQRHFTRALNRCEHQVEPTGAYVRPRGYGNNGPAYYAARREIDALARSVEQLGLDDIDVVIEDNATTIL